MKNRKILVKMFNISSDRGRPPATRVLAEPLPSGHLPLWIVQPCLPLTTREPVRDIPKQFSRSYPIK